MQVNSDPLQVGDANFVEPVEVMMVEVCDGLKMDMNTGEQGEELTEKTVSDTVKLVFP